MAKLKKGFEGCKFYGTAGAFRFKGKPLGEMTGEELQAILDSDPKNNRKMIEGTPGKAAPRADNRPEEPLPKKP